MTNISSCSIPVSSGNLAGGYIYLETMYHLIQIISHRLNPDATATAILAERYKANLTETVRMFLAIHQLSVIPTRSWAITYHGLSSALLLGILSDTKTDPEVRRLQGDLITALSATAAKEQGESRLPKPDKDIELSGPLWRALAALKNIYDYGSMVGSGCKKRRDSSNDGAGNCSPLLARAADGERPATANTQQGNDPHQDAALGRAQQNNIDMDNLGRGNVDPVLYIALMDLYELIWVGKGPQSSLAFLRGEVRQQVLIRLA